jgi:hypothetical protein
MVSRKVLTNHAFLSPEPCFFEADHAFLALKPHFDAESRRNDEGIVQ